MSSTTITANNPIEIRVRVDGRSRKRRRRHSGPETDSESEASSDGQLIVTCSPKMRSLPGNSGAENTENPWVSSKQYRKLEREFEALKKAMTNLRQTEMEALKKSVEDLKIAQNNLKVEEIEPLKKTVNNINRRHRELEDGLDADITKGVLKAINQQNESRILVHRRKTERKSSSKPENRKFRKISSDSVNPEQSFASTSNHGKARRPIGLISGTNRGKRQRVLPATPNPRISPDMSTPEPHRRSKVLTENSSESSSETSSKSDTNESQVSEQLSRSRSQSPEDPASDEDRHKSDHQEQEGSEPLGIAISDNEGHEESLERPGSQAEYSDNEIDNYYFESHNPENHENIYSGPSAFRPIHADNGNGRGAAEEAGTQSDTGINENIFNYARNHPVQSPVIAAPVLNEPPLERRVSQSPNQSEYSDNGTIRLVPNEPDASGCAENLDAGDDEFGTIDASALRSLHEGGINAGEAQTWNESDSDSGTDILEHVVQPEEPATVEMEIDKVEARRLAKKAKRKKYREDHKKYACDVPQCTFRYQYEHEIIRHRRIHTNEKPFGCSQCNKSYKEKHHLTRHEKAIHPKIYTPVAERAKLGTLPKSNSNSKIKKGDK